MIRDAQLILCEQESIAGTAGSSKISTNVINFGQVQDCVGALQNDRINVSNRLLLNVVVEGEALVAAVDGCVVTLELYNDTDEVPTAGGDVIITKAITVNVSGVPIGTQLASIALPFGQLKPFIGLKASITAQNLSTGKISAWIGTEMQQGGKIGQL